jgi:hypothetical protein
VVGCDMPPNPPGRPVGARTPNPNAGLPGAAATRAPPEPRKPAGVDTNPKPGVAPWEGAVKVEAGDGADNGFCDPKLTAGVPPKET